MNPVNRMAEPVARSDDHRRRSDVADRNARIIALRRNKPKMRTVLLPLSAVGETCQMDRIVALLKRIDGVSSACLFFNRTVMRIYFHPEQTNVNQILEALRVLKPNLHDYHDYHNLKKDLSRIAMYG